MTTLALTHCQSTPQVADPLKTLQTTEISPRLHEAALAQLDATPDDPQYIATLRRMISQPGYTKEMREAAVDRLAEHDLDGLKRTIRMTLPRLEGGNWAWLTRLCELIAERNWTDCSGALINSWARPAGAISDLQRPEYLALASMYGADRVIDVVFETFVNSNDVAQQGLRTRCWELLLRLGRRDQLLALLADSNANTQDAMLIDLRAAAKELGIIPANREEILCIRKLRQPERAEFWTSAVDAVNKLGPEQKASLELRDLPTVVAAAAHDPELLTTSKDQLYARLSANSSAQEHHLHGSNLDGFAGDLPQMIYQHRADLTWGDMAAMVIVSHALAVPEVVAHLFDYAERDRMDNSTEFGGVLDQDAQGRFEVREFPPRIRQHDQRFNAPQEMVDAGYTALCHFHNHVQRFRNAEYAGPGTGDLNYADNMRVNCVVFTYVKEGVLNVDFYRRDKLIVDLGDIHSGQ